MPNESTTPPDSGQPPVQSQAPKVDLQKLTEKVYRLMQEDVRLEQARRQQWPERRRPRR
jgi:hypothetical protein